jgi:hypothetical protein
MKLKTPFAQNLKWFKANFGSLRPPKKSSISLTDCELAARSG